MNEPKRWSSSGSDVDPVVRSVLRYARDLQPNSAELRRVVQGAQASGRPALAPRSRLRRRARGLVAFAATFAAGAALASYANRHWLAPAGPTALPSVAPTSVAPSAAPLGVSRARTPVASPSVTPTVAVNGPARTRTAPSAVVSAPPELDATQDATMLQAARSVVASNPARALSLTRDHELHFPSSALAEERQALRIEALARLGRRAEAARELAGFEQRFPRSIYARRLHALPLP